jgi:hypothetical protein
MAQVWVDAVRDEDGNVLEEGYYYDDGATEESNTNNDVEIPGADNSDVTGYDPTEEDVMPIGVRTSMGEGMGFATRNADGSVSYEDPDGGTYTKTSGGSYVTGSGSSAVTYNPSTGTFTDSAGKPLTVGSGGFSIPKQLTNLFKTGGEYDIGKILPLLGGAFAMTQSNNRTQPSGYQGGIPTYTATRQTPGIGQLLSGNVLYRTPDKTTTNADGTVATTPGTVVNPNSAAPSTGIAPPKEEVVTKAKGGALESGGFVIPADVVSHLGNGSSAAGLRLLAQRYGATPIKGKGDGMSDSIRTTIDGRQPARVANEEARLTKPQVQAAGGAQKLYAMMEKIREARTGSKQQGRQIDPRKYMPGGSIGYAGGGIVPRYETGGTTKLPTGTTGTESNLSNWAGSYVTDMLGKGKALSEMPFEQYKGDLTAGASDLQNKVSTGLQGITFPGNLGGSFSSTTAPTIGANGQPAGGGGIASNYMNPYLSAVLNPQLAEMRRQAEINNLSGVGNLTKSGAFGGGRQAIMQSEAGRNLLTEQNKTIGQGYSNAYDKGMQQFNVEQGQAKDLAGLMAQQGAVDRGIESEDIAANKAQFEEARLNPYKMVQFQQSLLSGLPLAAQTYNQAPTDNLTQFSNAATTLSQLLKNLGQTSSAATTAAK